jgi:hypothetical protein
VAMNFATGIAHNQGDSAMYTPIRFFTGDFA